MKTRESLTSRVGVWRGGFAALVRNTVRTPPNDSRPLPDPGGSLSTPPPSSGTHTSRLTNVGPQRGLTVSPSPPKIASERPQSREAERGIHVSLDHVERKVVESAEAPYRDREERRILQIKPIEKQQARRAQAQEKKEKALDLDPARVGQLLHAMGAGFTAGNQGFGHRCPWIVWLNVAFSSTSVDTQFNTTAPEPRTDHGPTILCPSAD